MDFYQILGVPRTATAKDIKLAYYREAKKSHPDMNPGDPKAKIKFQQVSQAYEILGDEKKRRQYDASGTYSQSPAGEAPDPEEMFNSVQRDAAVIQEAFTLYVGEVFDEIKVIKEPLSSLRSLPLLTSTHLIIYIFYSVSLATRRR